MKTVPHTGTIHLGILTKDIKTTVEFYEFLGFKIVKQSDCGDLFFMEMGNFTIETFISPEVHPIDGAIDHLCLDTDDIDTAYEMVKERGYELLTPVIFEQVMCHYPIRFIKFRGPNKEIIELLQTYPDYQPNDH